MAIAALPTARWFFDLESLPLTDAIALALLALTWSAALYVLRGLGLVERLARLRAG